MLTRERFEKEYRMLYDAPYGIGTTVWGPLKSGLLSGKYLSGDVPEDSRANHYDFIKSQIADEAQNEVIGKLQGYARETFECSVASLAIAWVAKNKNVSTVLLGASNESQIEENLEAMGVAQKMTSKHLEEIEAILGNKPEAEPHWGRVLQNSIETL